MYLIFDAHLLNADAADALLKDLEEPPPYAVVVLVADELGPLPETIRSRCQLVPFRRLSERAVRAEAERLAPGLTPDELTAVARVAAGRLDRVARLLDPDAARRRAELLAVARAVVRRPGVRPAAAAQTVTGARGRARRPRSGPPPRRRSPGGSCRTARPSSTSRRAERGAEREEILLALEELAAWYRDLVVVAAGAERAVVHYDRLAELAEDATVERMPGAERAAEVVRESLADVRGVQRRPAARARGAVRPGPARASPACPPPSERAASSETGRRAQVFSPDRLSLRNRRPNLTERRVMRRFLLLASALVALAVLSAAGAATAKAPPKHKRTSHAAAKAAVKKPAKAKPAARAKAKPRHTVVPPTAAPVVGEDDDQVEDQAEDVDNTRSRQRRGRSGRGRGQQWSR